jgi:alpha-aminoadipate carrier protein LysW
MKSKVECQECGADISVPEDSVVGEIVTCPDCGGDYEIASKGEKVELKPA